MTEDGELAKSLKRIISHVDRALNRIKGLTDTSPKLQELKLELEAKLSFAENVPDDRIEERYPGLLDIELQYEKLVGDTVSHFVVPSDEFMLLIHSSTASASAYQEFVLDPHQSDLNIYPNMDKVKDGFILLAKDKSRKNETPKKL